MRMNRLGALCVAALLAGLAGMASAQVSIDLTITPSTVIAYGTPVTELAEIFGDNNCGGKQVTFYDGISQIGTATTFQISSNPAPAQCDAILTPNSYTSSFSFGPHVLAATYNSIQSPENVLSVNKASTTITLATTPNPGTWLLSTPVTLTATVSHPGGGTPTGTVTVDVNGNFLNLNNLPSSGVDSYGVIFSPPGTYSLTASYSGDSNYFGSMSGAVTQTINKVPSTVTLATTPNPSTAGKAVTLTATVSGPQASPTGFVSFSDNGGPPFLAGIALSNGTASARWSELTVGAHSLAASYGGDSFYLGSVSTGVNQTVNQIVTVTSLQVVPTVGQTVALTATVAPSTAAGTVTFLDGATTIGAAALNAGTATSTATLSVGSHSLTASYGGDTNDATSVSSPVTETVNQIVTTTTLQALPTSSNTGQTVALTATVSPSTAAGNVTFQDGATTIGIAPLSAGTANFSISTLATGRHSLTASYGGDTNDAPSVSSPVVESVALLPTATALAAAPNPSVAGQSVTLTATVMPGNPTGTVSFFDGANLLGSGALSNGVATLATSSLTAANHSLTASYGGDANNAPSTSPVVSQLVNPGSTGTGAPNPIAVSPASGSGSSEVMSFTFNDPRGWQDLDIVNVLIGNFLDGRNVCYLAYSRSAGVLYLVADNGGTLSSGLALGGSGSVSNSQCTVAGAASSASGSGNTLTLTLNMLFSAGFGGNKVVYLAARDLEGGNSGWQALGVWQAVFTPAGTIAVVSLTPARGAAVSGTAQAFIATLTDSMGTGDFGVVNVLVNNFIDGRNACYLAYVAASNSLLLVDDGGDAGGPFAGSMVLNGGAAVIQNSQCSVNGPGSSAVKNGNTLTLTLNVTFKAPFAGNRIVWVAGRDAAGGNNTDWQAMATTSVQ